MNLIQLSKPLLAVAVLGGLATASYFTRDAWLPWFQTAKPSDSEHRDHAEAAAPPEQVLLTIQAQNNLRLTSRPLKAGTYWKTLQVPGMVIDRPGLSDRGIVAPVTGVVSSIHRFAGDTVRPGEALFTLKLLSESLHLTQTDLFKTTQDLKLAEAQRKRLAAGAGAVPEARIIEVESQITRYQVATKAYRQELLNRGLSPEQIDGVSEGKFVAEIPIVVPARPTDAKALPNAGVPNLPGAANAPSLEVQELKVELGQQVQAGQTLCLLSNHQILAIEGRAFRDETPLLERSVKEGWPVEVDFREGDNGDWPKLEQTFPIRYLANNIDPETRTFRFLMTLDNQSRTIDHDGKAQLLWRFRPGQRIRLLVRVEKLDNVFVLPVGAVVREGAEAYVFRQNGDVFDRKPVRVVHQDGQLVVVANDGSVPPGIFVAQTGAAQLNRMLKSQTGAMPKGFHIHADGSVHTGSH